MSAIIEDASVSKITDQSIVEIGHGAAEISCSLDGRTWLGHSPDSTLSAFSAPYVLCSPSLGSTGGKTMCYCLFIILQRKSDDG